MSAYGNFLRKTGLDKRYEAIIAVCCFLMLFCNLGLAFTAFSVYQPYIVEIPGIGHTGGTLILTVRGIAMLVTMLFAAVFYERLNCRIGACAATLISAAAFVCFGLADNMALLMAGAVLAGAGYSLGGMVGTTLLIGRWFCTDTGTVIGIAAAGSGVASLVLPPLAVAIIDSTSLSASFFVEAVFLALVAALLFLLVRNDPADLGLQPHGADRESTADSKPQTGSRYDVPEKLLPLIFVTMIFFGAAAVDAPSYLSVLYTTNGFTKAEGATVVAAFGGALLVVKLVAGFLFDRIGAKAGSALLLSLGVVGFGLSSLAGFGGMPFAIAVTIILGAGCVAGSVGISMWSIDFAPHGKETRTIKNMQLGYVAGGAIFNLVPGTLYEAVGSYGLSYGIMGVCYLVSLIVIVLVYSYLQKRPAALAEAAGGE